MFASKLMLSLYTYAAWGRGPQAYDDYLQKYHSWEKDMEEYKEQMRLYRLQYPEAAAAVEAQTATTSRQSQPVPQPPPPGTVAQAGAAPQQAWTNFGQPWQQAVSTATGITTGQDAMLKQAGVS